MKGVIEASGLRKNFGETAALRGVTVSVHAGECVGLLGPNGAGKSTFINILYGAVSRTAGELTVFGLDPATQAKAIKRRLGVVPQENALDEGLTVEENMILFSRFVGLAPERRAARIAELLGYMNLDHKKDATIHELSGGMKRRLAFVRALLADPEMLILDEPTTGLDPAVRHLLWDKVADFRRAGKTILVSTHYMHEAEALCDRVVVMNHGKIADAGTPRELIRAHTPGFVAIFSDSPALQTHLAAERPLATVTRAGTTLVRTTALDDLVRLQRDLGVEAQQMRPANLEDVFLKITGEDLSQDA
jgi:lipooligosaccharide transport system ATP-binding protein